MFIRRLSQTYSGCAVLFAAVVLSSCNNKNLINKTKYEGQKITNTCQSFTEEINALIEANSGPNKLRVAEYDNSQFNYLFLEPGQVVLNRDTLYIRMISDLEFEKYLTKGVAIVVNAKYASQDHLKNLEKNPEGELGKLTIDRAYYDANKDPNFVYKIPVGDKVDGKQITLSFSIIQNKKNGSLKKVFCNTVENPLGPLDISGVTDRPWDPVKIKSVVQVPEVDIKDEKYRYRTFTGTLDLIFPIESVKPIDPQELNNVIVNYISKYENEGFKLQNINIAGYASQGGPLEYNQQLSQNRSESIFKELNKYFEDKGRAGSIKIDFAGRGEDWERFQLLVKTANFSDGEKSKLLEIASSGASPDEKEAELRKYCGYKFGLPDKRQPDLWKRLVSDVLSFCRHTYITFQFDYAVDKMYVDPYTAQIPMISPELYNVATKQSIISKCTPNSDIQEGVRVLNVLIDENGNKKANLHAMRSTYFFAQSEIAKALADMEAAMELDKENLQYGLAALSYKTKFADSYSLNERLKILNSYNSYVEKNPTNGILLANRAVMMDKVGYISGALAEYGKFAVGNSKTAITINNRGVANLKTNRLIAAEADFLEAIKMDSKLAEAHFNLAIVYAWRGLNSKATDAFEKAIALNKSFCAEVAKNPAFRILKTTPKFKKLTDC
jgi:Tfp pilus assembly protein PilF